MEDLISKQEAVEVACDIVKYILEDDMPLSIKLSDNYLYENVAKRIRAISTRKDT